MAQRVTINDIAASVGVSRQTVTRALNGMPRISEETRAKILAASDRLGYRPSRFASNLRRTKRSRAIGLVVASFRNPYYAELTADLLAAASARGWHVTVSAREHEPESDLLPRLAGEVDAIVGYLAGPEEEIAAATRGLPVVLIDRPTKHPRLQSAHVDYESAIANLLAELRKRGSRRFGMLDPYTSGQYHKTGRRIIYEQNVDAPSRRAIAICESSYETADAGADGFRALIAKHPRTDTVIAFNDQLAMGALRAAHEDGIRVPDDVRIMGIDGLSLGSLTWPPLSTLAIVGTELTDRVIELLEIALDNHPERDKPARIVPQPIWRGTA